MSNPGDPRWYHITVHTYGSWLYGDGRGFRTRHHREHVEGDYKNPPPKGMYERAFERSQSLMKQPPVVVPGHLRPVIGAEFWWRLAGLGAQVIAVSMAGKHLHALAKMPPGETPRKWVGLAKKHTAFVVNDHGWVRQTLGSCAAASGSSPTGAINSRPFTTF